MKTLTLIEAAQFLKLHPEELRQRAKRGVVPGAKVGRCWVFLESRLIEYVESLYTVPRQALRATKGDVCRSAKEVEFGGLISTAQVENEYDEALELATKRKRPSTTTS